MSSMGAETRVGLKQRFFRFIIACLPLFGIELLSTHECMGLPKQITQNFNNAFRSVPSLDANVEHNLVEAFCLFE